ncbi:MAG: hypothetical protein KBS98_06350, partial [Flavobacterium sp.]|nr:hypothetical protein [Candidatus Neoflavobacterium equi]
MKNKIILILLCLHFGFTYGQQKQPVDYNHPALIHYFNEEHTKFIQFSGYVEFWARYSQLNPGSMINEEHKSSVTDLSLRRVRAKLTYKPTDKLLLVLQIGPTNVNFNSKSNTYMDLLDAYAEYKFSDYFSIGGGKSSWKGLHRFSSGPMATLLYDMPNFAYANTGVLDQVFRNMNVYAKGQFGQFDYRVAVAQPNPTVTSDPQYNRAVFNKLAPKKDFSGYFRYAFKETESNFTPFNAGTYVGKKEVLSLGVGFEHM